MTTSSAVASEIDGMSANVTPSVAPKTEPVSARGVIKAAREAEVSVALSARISSMPYSTGDSFKKGATLVRFDCERISAELEALKSAKSALEKTEATSRELFAHGAAGQLELDLATADVQRADAEARAKRAQLKDCVIRAPYAGYVVKTHVDPFETPSTGSPLLKIMDNGPREIEMIVPSMWLRWLKVGTTFDFNIDEVGVSYPAKISRIGRAVDPVSRTIEITATFTSDSPAAIAGMSGVGHFNAEVSH
ncbi:MAG: efflux RND transporter periplasmic adaptor subunit [Hyphomonas sp.]